MILKRRRGDGNGTATGTGGSSGGGVGSGTAGSLITTTMIFMVVTSVLSLVSFVTYERIFIKNVDDRLLAIHHQQQEQQETASSATRSNLRQGRSNNDDHDDNTSQYEICFITSVFTDNIAHADRVQDVTQHAIENPTFGYFGYTNDHRISMPGWTKIVLNLPKYKRMITQSRYPKFMAWKDAEHSKKGDSSNSGSVINIQEQCQVVFYMDGIVIPISGDIAREQLKKLALSILNSKYGLAQYQHSKGGGAISEFQRIITSKKDTPDNVIASIDWFNSQSDWKTNGENCTLYENRIFGYNPRNIHYQKAATSFWNHYSLEVDSWRDQPLWCYTLSHFNIKPIEFNPNDLFKTKLNNMGHGGHHYGW